MALWIVWALVVSTLFGMAAHIGESALRGIRRQGRWVWVAAIVGSTLVPAWSLVPTRTSTPSEPLLSAPGDVGLEGVVGSIWVDIEAIVAPNLGERLDTYLIVLWLGASAILLTGLVVGSWRLRAKAAKWPRRRVSGHDVLVSEDFGPAVFGLRAPFIVVPRWLLGQREDTIALVCAHEAQHRDARDTSLLTLAAIALVAMPWNVALWWQISRLRSAVELDCDQRVIAAGAPRTTYASTLLSIGAGTDSYSFVMPRFAQSPTLLERRLTMLIEQARKRGPAKSVASLVAVVGLTVLGCGVPAPAESPAPEPPVVSDGPSVVSDTGVSGVPAPERHPSVFDYPPPAADGAAGVVPYRPVIATRVLPPTVGGILNERPSIGTVGLFLIDGVRVPEDSVRALDPNTIESIEIIKGPAATDLFGPEASQGVVTVVMKRN
jgi:hypothetical protein